MYSFVLFDVAAAVVVVVILTLVFFFKPSAVYFPKKEYFSCVFYPGKKEIVKKYQENMTEINASAK